MDSSRGRLHYWIEYLKDPELVVKFQRYFGINSVEDEDAGLSAGGGKRKRMGHSRSSSSSTLLNQTKAFTEDISTHSRSISSNKSDENERRRRVVQRIPQFEEDSAYSTGSSSVTTSSSSARNQSSTTRDEDDNDSSSSSSKLDGLEVQNENTASRFVKNKFWYYLFLFGTALGDETWYAFFFCFWFWNVDGAVGRRVVLVWTIIMYIGQSLKDIIRWPRPSSPPVVRLERKWELEYGMPSTHAMVGAGVPFSVIFFTASRYEYPIGIGVGIAVIWCSIVCCSRIYLGMHSVLDIIAGLGLIALLFIWVIPLADWLDPILLKSDYGGFLLFTGTILMAIFSPGGDRWTPARGDTIVILGSCSGLLSGAIVNYQLGIIRGPPIEPPYPVLWPGTNMLGLSLLRLMIGLCVVVATRALVKSAAYATIRTLVHSKEISYIANATKKEVLVELTYKFLTYTAIGFNVVYLAPAVFRLIGIERPTFHTEI